MDQVPTEAEPIHSVQRRAMIYRNSVRGLPTHPEGRRGQVNGAWPSLWYTNKCLTIRS